jgi:hypothetical protein
MHFLTLAKRQPKTEVIPLLTSPKVIAQQDGTVSSVVRTSLVQLIDAEGQGVEHDIGEQDTRVGTQRICGSRALKYPEQ